ncbi:hypothetical protein LQW54_000645 [Pestalotiopsis sp. IQ-011]
MFPNTNPKRIAPFRTRGNSLASISEMGSFRSLRETTNRPQGPGPKCKTDILPSQPANKTANFTSTYDHTDHHSKDGLRKALLSSDWRQRPSGDAEENLPQVRTLANYRYEPQPYKTDTFDQALQLRGMQRQDDISQGQESSSVANIQQNSSHDTNGAFNDSFQGSDGDRGDDNSSRNNVKQLTDRFRLLNLGPKHFLMLSNLLGPAPCRGNENTSANGSPSDGPHGFGLATVSDSIFGLSADVLSASTIQPTVELQEVINLNGLRSRPWDSLGNDDDHNRRLPDTDSSHDTWSSYEVVEKSHSGETCSETPSKEETAEDKRFENMLAKLKTGTSEKTASPQTSDGGQVNKHTRHNLEFSSGESTSKHSSDSAEDQFVGEKSSRSRATTLNPKAPSFFTVDRDKKPSTYAARSRPEGHRPSLSEIFNRPFRAAGETNTLCGSPRHHLNSSQQTGPALNSEMLGGLAGKIKRAVLDSQQIEELTGAPPTDSQVQAIMQRLGIRSPRNQINPWTHASNVPSFSTRGQPTPIQQFFSSHDWNQYAGPSTIPLVTHDTPAGGEPQVMPPMGPAMSNGPVIGLAPALPLPGPEIGSHTNGYIPNTFLPPGMPLERGIYQRSESSIKDIMSTINKEISTNQATTCRDEPGILGPLCIPPFGPKPVMKPKGPPRPHDAMWHKKQQEYEAYLEHQRAQNPTYHRECRDRQAKRADRKRHEDMSRHFVFPPKKSAAIAIKKPDEVVAEVESTPDSPMIR